MEKTLAVVFFCVLSTVQLSSASKEAVVCEGRQKSISCPSGQVITVIHANYGRYDMNRCPHKKIKTINCFSSSSSVAISRSCNGRQFCKLYSRNSIFGDPCKGTYKYLRVLYKCNKSVYKRVVICEGSSRKIKCPTGQVIYIDRATYGRAEKHTCPSTAIRTTSCYAYHSRNIVTANCHYKRSCLLQANNLIFGDPCVGTYKYLTVKYHCIKPRHKEAIACEGRSRSISCPHGKSIRIHIANYGRTDAVTCPSSAIKTTRCFARHSTLKVASSCNGKRVCVLIPRNNVFGDPCRGTYKYLRVLYECV